MKKVAEAHSGLHKVEYMKSEGDGYTFHHSIHTPAEHRAKNPHDGLDFSDAHHVHETIVKHHGKHVGHITSGREGKKLYVGDAALDEAHQGKGVGKRMYREHFAHAAKHGVESAHSSMASEEAERVHRSLGAKESSPGRFTHHLKKGEDEDWMGPAPKYDTSTDKPGEYHHHSVGSVKRGGVTHHYSILKHRSQDRYGFHVHDPKDHAKVTHESYEHDTAGQARHHAKRHISKLDE